MKFVRGGKRFLRNQGFEVRQAETSGKKRQRGSLTRSQEEFASAKIDGPAFLPRNVQATPMGFLAQKRKSNTGARTRQHPHNGKRNHSRASNRLRILNRRWETEILDNTRTVSPEDVRSGLCFSKRRSSASGKTRISFFGVPGQTQIKPWRSATRYVVGRARAGGGCEGCAGISTHRPEAS